MTQRLRLRSGGRIDRAKRLRFTFDGRSFQGYEGDTLASALLANGVSLVGRSFKYHRPRGAITAGSSEPNALVEIGEGGSIADAFEIDAPLLGDWNETKVSQVAKGEIVVALRRCFPPEIGFPLPHKGILLLRDL